jgi:AcrR family transcriptional regulator
MKTQKQNSRERIVSAANQLFYSKGYNQTSFADVAEKVGISKGNLHYHFHSKDDLLETVIAYRLQHIREQLLQWDEEFPSAKDKLKRFVQMMLNEQANLVRYGCPFGSLSAELGKYQRELLNKSREIFDLYQDWLEKAFKQDGFEDSKTLSQHLFSMAQGAALMTYVYEDADILKSECQKILQWIESL